MPTLDIKRNIASGRMTLVTDEGSEIDVLELISHIWQHNPQWITAGMLEAYRLKPMKNEQFQ